MRFLALVMFGLGLIAAPAAANGSDDGPRKVTRDYEWPEELLKAASLLPIQDGGRVKPLSTFADFSMLRLNGKRSLDLEKVSGMDRILVRLRVKKAQKLKPMAWLLDCIFFPDQADEYKVFRVEDSSVIHNLGLSTVGKDRFDHYSYRELVLGDSPEEAMQRRSKLYDMGGQARNVPPKERDREQRQLADLLERVHYYEQLRAGFYFASQRYAVPEDSALQRIFPGVAEVPVSGILEQFDEVVAHARAMGLARAEGGEAAQEAEAALDEVEDLLDVLHVGEMAMMLHVLPPVDEDEPIWRSPGELIAEAQTEGGSVPAPQVQRLAAMESLFELREDPEAFTRQFVAFQESIVSAAEARSEYDKVPMEYGFYRAGWLSWSQVVFVLAFLLVALTWLLPRSKGLTRAALGSVLVGLALLIVGVTLRCLIKGKPPVSTLYETILFITGCAVIVALVLEWITRMRVGLAIAALIGVAGMFLSFKYEASRGNDTMNPLVAVLDTNFWLATHVTTVTFGYAAGLLAGCIAFLHILGRLLGIKKGDKQAYREIARMVYGVLCFGLLLSVIGTILGGVWANDSWGRFWGWDPKENGALMICLWELAVLHARMGGYIRDHGLCMAAVFGNIVVSFSWWHVNELGVGLHAYGFTDGVLFYLACWYGLNGLVLLAGLGTMFMKKPPTPTAAAST